MRQKMVGTADIDKRRCAMVKWIYVASYMHVPQQHDTTWHQQSSAFSKPSPKQLILFTCTHKTGDRNEDVSKAAILNIDSNPDRKEKTRGRIKS